MVFCFNKIEDKLNLGLKRILVEIQESKPNS